MRKSNVSKLRTLMNHIGTSNAKIIALSLTLAALLLGGIFLLINEPLHFQTQLFIYGQIFILSLIIAIFLFNLKKNDDENSESNVEETDPFATDHNRLDGALKASNWPLEEGANLSPDRIQSIVRNSNRLFAVEKELSSLFRPRNVGDNYAKMLVCQLKICTSRLKSDLSEVVEKK